MITLYPPAGGVVPIPFDTFAKTAGGSITASGLAVGDIKIFKNGNTPARSSTNGITLADTDGIDFAGITGLHGFKIDLSDDSDAGFYSVGSWYWVGLSSITVDSETVNAWIAIFRIMEQENQLGVPDVNVTHWHSSPVPQPTVPGVPIVDVGYSGGDEITIALPANFSLLVIDSAGNVAANIRKIKDKGFSTTVKPFDIEP